eukprot:COSAG03_NODE_367_length_8529_cov_29.037841_2_plen_82_part_00
MHKRSSAKCGESGPKTRLSHKLDRDKRSADMQTEHQCTLVCYGCALISLARAPTARRRHLRYSRMRCHPLQLDSAQELERV